MPSVTSQTAYASPINNAAPTAITSAIATAPATTPTASAIYPELNSISTARPVQYPTATATTPAATTAIPQPSHYTSPPPNYPMQPYYPPPTPAQTKIQYPSIQQPHQTQPQQYNQQIEPTSYYSQHAQ